MRGLILLCALLSIAGCETMRIATTKKIESTVDEKTEKGWIQLSIPDSANIPQLVSNTCSPLPPLHAALLPAIWAPIATKYILDELSGAATDYVEDMKKKSSKQLTFKYVVTSDALKNANCIVIARGPNENKHNELIVLRIDRSQNTPKGPAYDFYGQGITLTPIYASLNKSLSITKCTNNCSGTNNEAGKINLAVAINATAARGNLQDLGTATTTIKELNLHTAMLKAEKINGKDQATEIGSTTSLIALPPSGIPVQLSVSLTDMGDIVGDPDIATGEIKAAAGALTEGVVSQVANHYK